jgi:hypothetical protein
MSLPLPEVSVSLPAPLVMLSSPAPPMAVNGAKVSAAPLRIRLSPTPSAEPSTVKPTALTASDRVSL